MDPFTSLSQIDPTTTSKMAHPVATGVARRQEEVSKPPDTSEIKCPSEPVCCDDAKKITQVLYATYNNYTEEAPNVVAFTRKTIVDVAKQSWLNKLLGKPPTITQEERFVELDGVQAYTALEKGEKVTFVPYQWTKSTTCSKGGCVTKYYKERLNKPTRDVSNFQDLKLFYDLEFVPLNPSILVGKTSARA